MKNLKSAAMLNPAAMLRLALLALVASPHALARIASPRALVMAKAGPPKRSPTPQERAAQSAADKLKGSTAAAMAQELAARKRLAQSAADKLGQSDAAAMSQELAARKQLAQSAADKLRAGTLAGPAAAVNSSHVEQLLLEMRRTREATEKLLAETKKAPTVVKSAHVEQLVVEMRHTLGAAEKLLAETKKAPRAAALRFGIAHAKDGEFTFRYSEEQDGEWCLIESKSGWVVKKILLSFQRGRKQLLNDLFERVGDLGHVGDQWTNESERAFVTKLVNQIDKLIGEKPRVHKTKIIYDDAQDWDIDEFEYTLSLP